MRAKIDAEVNRFGSKGLRTLVFAMREMSQSEFDSIDWSQRGTDTLSNLCEKELQVIACTGVEDELQDEVCECI